jgi:putative hemolysin
MDDPDPANILPQLILILVLTLVNAFFASAEMAVVSVNKTKIKRFAEEGNDKAKLISKLLEEPSRFLSTIQVAITLAGFFSSASAATGISSIVGSWLGGLGVPYAQPISLVAITLLLSYFTLVFGELVPKRIALQKAEAIAMFSVKPILLVQTIASPFVRFLAFSTNLVLRLFGMKTEGLDEQVSKEEIKSMVEVGQETGVFNETETEMINSIFEFDDIVAEEVMTPRTDVFLINASRPVSEYLDELLAAKYSRIPVYEGDTDNIIGVLYMKDFIIEARKNGFEQVDVRSILHPPYLVPERKNIDVLFKEMQAAHRQIAVLIDEYGGFSGIVTMEDLIEEITGEIDDEHEAEDPDIHSIDSNTFLVKGGVLIEDLNDELGLSLDEESDGYDTLGGFLITLLGRIPKEGEQPELESDGLLFKVQQVRDNRIEQVKICRQLEAEKQE